MNDAGIELGRVGVRVEVKLEVSARVSSPLAVTEILTLALIR